jgi:hypothetical protein
VTGPDRRGSGAADDLAPGLADAEILELVRDRGDLAAAALAELGRRQPDAAGDEAARLVDDRQAPDRLRSAAATELGRQPGARSERALLAALAEEPGGALKHVARSLGRIGGAAALTVLDRAPDPPGPAARQLRFARSLIAYRLGRSEHLIDPGAVRADRPGPESAPLRVRPLGADEVEARWSDVRRELPASPMSRRGSVEFRCGNSQHWILLAAELDERGAERLARAPMIAGAVLKLRACADRYTLDEYLLTSGDGEVLDLVGVRESGVVVHAGTVSITGGVVSFGIDAHHPPYARPIRLAGLFDPARPAVAFSTAVVGRVSEAAVRARRPRRMVAPG